jgi:hypothetical protein
MYFWNTKLLSKDFAINKVTARQRLYYYLGYSVYEVLNRLYNLRVIDGIDFSRTSTIEVLTKFICCTIGILWCYRANESVDGKEFIDRLISFIFANYLRFILYGFIYLFLITVPYILIKRWFHVELPQSPTGAAVSNALVMAPLYLIWLSLVRRDILRIKKYRDQNVRE